MFDLNAQREKDEAAIADETVRQLVENFESPNAGTPMHVAHCFGLACDELRMMPEDADAAKRVLDLVSKKIKAVREVSERIAEAVKVVAR